MIQPIVLSHNNIFAQTRQMGKNGLVGTVEPNAPNIFRPMSVSMGCSKKLRGVKILQSVQACGGN